jgi:hypothetical protein
VVGGYDASTCSLYLRFGEAPGCDIFVEDDIALRARGADEREPARGDRRDDCCSDAEA